MDRIGLAWDFTSFYEFLRVFLWVFLLCFRDLCCKMTTKHSLGILLIIWRPTGVTGTNKWIEYVWLGILWVFTSFYEFLRVFTSFFTSFSAPSHAVSKSRHKNWKFQTPSKNLSKAQRLTPLEQKVIEERKMPFFWSKKRHFGKVLALALNAVHS